MAIPIFVLGVQRSGTTWLANQLCAHDEIVGVQHEQHHGIHESGYFVLIEGRYGDLRIKGNFIEFAEVMLASDYFSLARVTREFLYDQFGCDYPAIFGAVMDRFAKLNGARYWVEKSPGHTRRVSDIARYYPNAKFVAIARDTADVLRSSMARRVAETRGKSFRYRYILQRTYRWAQHTRAIERFRRRFADRIVVVQYSELVENKRTTLELICNFLGVRFSEKMLIDQFAPDSSFRSEAHRQSKAMSSDELLLVRLLAIVWRILPSPVLNRLRREDGRRRVPLPMWFFRLSRSSRRENENFGRSQLEVP